MSGLNLHIVCFTIPYPVNYGGVFDLFYKLDALQRQGVAIHLHCIQYGDNQPQPILEQFCAKISYYPRRKVFPLKFWSEPYIVESRIIPDMITTINQDNNPVLIEGIHSSGIIAAIEKENRKILVRICNVEYVYYENLYRSTSSFLKKIYYKIESSRLFRWEKSLVENGVHFSALSQLDEKIYKEKLGCKNINYLPLFLPDWQVKTQEGTGKFCLYHGNLDVEENQKAIQWLITEVFGGLSIPLVIAGKSNGKFVKEMRTENEVITWIENPNEADMQNLIEETQIHLLPSFNQTGIKLKLLNALFNGRFCICNQAMIQDTGLDSLCVIAETADDFRNYILEYWEKHFDAKETELRKQVLSEIYDNNKNAIRLKKILFNE